MGIPLIATGAWPLGVAMLGIAQGRCGLLMHEAGHYSLTTSALWDTLLEEMVYGLGCGLSAGWWRRRPREHYWAGSVFAPVICLLVKIAWQFVIHPLHVLCTFNLREALWMVLRAYLITTLLRNTATSMMSAVGCFFVYEWIASMYAFSTFVVSHPPLALTAKHIHAHWVDNYSQHAANITPHWFTNWWMGCLNFQMEHHLFPSMPHERLPMVAKRVQSFFETHDLKYNAQGFFDSVQDNFRDTELPLTSNRSKRPPPICTSNLDADGAMPDLHEVFRF